MKKIVFSLVFLFLFHLNYAQTSREHLAGQWADSVFNTLTDNQRIAQLMIIRESSFSPEGPVYYDSLIRELIQEYNIGGICLFQGSPVKQAGFINEFQAMAQTPLMVCIDGEWGLGMRFDSVKSLKHQMMLGAANDPNLVYEYGRLVGRQMKRMGIQVDYAPVVDINNNPDNPVINDRSFGEDKYRVADLGLAYMRGLQNEGIMACAKHFPGHGDVSVDSHLDLPVINKSLAQLDTLELYPFKRMIEGGIASIMIGHLFIPALDSTPHTASSISKNIVTGLLREKLHFTGLTFTDALGMKGVAKYFPGGKIAAQSLIAGNDMLCLPESVPDAINAIRAAIDSGRLSWNDIYEKCKKVLRYKYMYGVNNIRPVNTSNLTNDLNQGIDELNYKIAQKAITLLNKRNKIFFPLKKSAKRKIAYIGVGLDSANTFANLIASDFGSDNFYISYKEDSSNLYNTIASIKGKYKNIVIGLHNYKRYPANQYGISNEIIRSVKNISSKHKTILFAFGNPYALQYFCDIKNLVACYEDDSTTQRVAAEMVKGLLPYRGTLSVSVCPKLPAGSGIITAKRSASIVSPGMADMDGQKLRPKDSFMNVALKDSAFPDTKVPTDPKYNLIDVFLNSCKNPDEGEK